MRHNTEQVFENKPPKWVWIGKILWSVVSLRAFIFLFKKLAVQIVDSEIGHRNAKIGKNVRMSPTVIIREPQNVSIGDNCYFNHNTIMIGGHVHGRLIIGNNVLTGPNVGFYVANHRFCDKDTPINKQGYIENDIVVGDNVWIGANSIITSGVVIGEGTIIGAGSVVTNDIPPMSIAVGAPAKVVKTR